MIVRHLYQGHELLTVLDQPTAEMARLRALLTLPDGRHPTRRTWERRLAALPATLKLRSAAIEHFNEQFKGIFDVHGPVPTKGLANTCRFALGAILVYQLALWHRHEHSLDLRVDRKPARKAA